MKALTLRQYGSPDFLKIQEVDKPVPGPKEVLIKVKAASINDWDSAILHGKPFIPNRLMAGILRPRLIIGCDMAGRVEAVGSDVSTYQIGDSVYGDLSAYGFGGFAEYVCAPESAIIFKPPNMSFQQAAAIPQAGMLALQGLMAGGQPKAGQSVLINGAGGGVGSIAIQLLKLGQVEVTGVDREDKLEVMQSWGFDHTIDYGSDDFTRMGRLYDFILDVKTDRSPADYERALNPGGVYATVGGRLGKLLRIALSGLRIKWTRGKKLCVVALQANRDLGYFNEHFETGQFNPVLDSEFAFTDTEVRSAFHHFDSGSHKGKIIIRLGS